MAVYCILINTKLINLSILTEINSLSLNLCLTCIKSKMCSSYHEPYWWFIVETTRDDKEVGVVHKMISPKNKHKFPR